MALVDPAHTRAKEEWLKSFQGATLTLEPEFGSPKVNHMYARNFDHMGRNAFFISVRGRIDLGEEQVTLAEKHVYDRIEEITKALDRKIETAKAVVIDANITVMANYNKPVTQKAVIVSPMQKRYLDLLKKCDELLKYMNTLMLHGEMSEREHSKAELEIKQHMRTIPSAIRKVTIGLRLRLREKNADAAPASDKPAANDDKAAVPAETTVEAAPSAEPIAAAA